MQICRSVSLAALLAVTAGLGCSAAPDAASGEDALNAANGAPTYDAEYLVFPTRADAETWFDGLRPMLGGMADGALVATTDARFARVQKMVDKHWAAITPIYAPNIPPPVTLVVESDIENAFAVYDPRVQKEANAIVVLSKILDLPDANVEAIIAHELGHLVTKNAIPKYQEAVFKYYEAPVSKEPLGIETPDDPAIRGVIEPYIGDAGEAGALTWSELHGFPVGGFYGQIFNQYLQTHYEPSKPTCQQFQKDYSATMTILQSGVSANGTEIVLDAAALAKLDPKAQALVTSSIACMEPAADQDFFQVLADMFQMSRDEVAASFPQAKQDAVVGKDALTGLYAITEVARGNLRTIKALPSFPQLRYYNAEEQADDFAMTVLHAESTTATDMGDAMLAFGTAEDKQACLDLVAANTVPAYGDLSDPHHSNCYRAFHSHAFEAYLQAGGKGVPPLDTRGQRIRPVAFNPTRHRILVD